MRRRADRGIRRGAFSATARLLVGSGLVIALLGAVSGTAAAVPPPPPNPSDSDIAAAGTRVEQQLGAVGELINQVAAANQQLAQLDADVAIKREDVNRALVDLQNARDAADVAAQLVGVAQQALADAGTQIQAAQTKFNDFAVSSYTKGTGVASISSFLGSTGPDDVLDRAQVLEVLSSSQNAVLDGLQRARTEQANKDSAARESKQQADAAASDAENKKAAAEDAIATARAALAAQAEQKTAIEAQRDSAQSQLDSARSEVAGLEGQRDAYSAWEQQKAAEDAAIAAAAAAARDAAVQAAARVAANQAAAAAAAAAAAGQRSHTDIDDSDSSPSPSTSTTPKKPRSGGQSNPSLTGSAAVELVIDRGMSQLGVPYSWGGGDENGPTKGIRDGGVADSYGDYNKVGFDCSGLMIYAFAGLGISLPHYTGYQYTAGKQVPSSDMKRGDMLFYGPNASQHVALYLGDGKMLEAPQSGSVVKVSPVRYDGMTPYAVRMVS
ncbi:invasin [Rhodococcus sp. 06-1059B-a]|nr:NlpC/P60 family protein [Rhodococcus sp. 06-1059B-a]OZD60213.1 invasin [Rhodococcus sp. 06-1059B-a]